MARGSGRRKADTSSAATPYPATLTRKALAAEVIPSHAPARRAGSIRFGPMMEPAAEPQTISPMARPRWAAGVMSAAAYRASRFDVLATPNSTMPISITVKLLTMTPSMPMTAPATARP
jgi:hypothetical protein